MEAGSIVLDVARFIGLLTISYRTAKAMKSRFDAELDEEVEREQSQYTTVGTDGLNENDPDPEEEGEAVGSCEDSLGHESYDEDIRRPATVSQILHKSPGRKSLLSKRRRYSTTQRTSLFEEQSLRTALLLKFWILLGIFQLATGFGIFYAAELRSLLILVGCLPLTLATPVVLRCHAVFAAPLLEQALPALASAMRSHAHTVLDALSPFYRRALSLTLFYASQYAPTEDLMAAERNLGREQALIGQTRKARRLALLQAGDERPMHDGDYLDDDEVAFAGYRLGGAGAQAMETPSGILPGRVSDMWGMATPGPKSTFLGRPPAAGTVVDHSRGRSGGGSPARAGPSNGQGAMLMGIRSPGEGRKRPASVGRAGFAGLSAAAALSGNL